MIFIKLFRSGTALTGILLFAGLTTSPVRAAAPASQNFDAIAPQESMMEDNPSLILDGVVYSTNALNDALRVDTVASVTGNLPTLGTGNALSSAWWGTNTATFLQFASVNNANDFRLLSLRAEVWGGSNGTAEIYLIQGYNNGELIASATVTFTSSGIYGSDGDDITYTRQTTLDEEMSSGNTANAGLLVFGSNWDNIDQMRFTVADGKIMGMNLDEISFAEPSVIPEPSTYAAIFGGLALLTAVYRRRKAT